MEPDTTMKGESIWNQMVHASGLQTELDKSFKCMEIETAWKRWIQRVQCERMIRDYQNRLQKRKN